MPTKTSTLKATVMVHHRGLPLTSHEFAATDLWSDAYLASPAVHEALDNFWANTAGPGGVGLQDRFAAMWAHVAQRPGPIRRWPATTSLMSQHREAQNLRYLPTSLAADFSDPQAKFSQLDHLNDEDVHRQIGDSLHPLVAAFETELVAPLMARVVSAVRQVDPHTLILREHNYFANLGIPSGQPPLEDSNWAYSPQRSADQREDPGFATIALSGSSAPVLTQNGEAPYREVNGYAEDCQTQTASPPAWPPSAKKSTPAV